MQFHVLDAKQRPLKSLNDHIDARRWFSDRNICGPGDAAYIVDDNGVLYGAVRLPPGNTAHVGIGVQIHVTMASSVYALVRDQAKREERAIGAVLQVAIAARRPCAVEPAGPRKRVVIQVPIALRDKLERAAAAEGVQVEKLYTDAVHGYFEAAAKVA